MVVFDAGTLVFAGIALSLYVSLPANSMGYKLATVVEPGTARRVLTYVMQKIFYCM
jgi:hypothetical protein